MRHYSQLSNAVVVVVVVTVVDVGAFLISGAEDADFKRACCLPRQQQPFRSRFVRGRVCCCAASLTLPPSPFQRPVTTVSASVEVEPVVVG